MFYRVLIVRTTSLSDRTATLGRQPVSRNVWLIRVKTLLDGILQSVKQLWYSATAAFALPLKNPYTKSMLQYSMWENKKGIFANCRAGAMITAFQSQGHKHRRAIHQLCWLQYLETQEAPIILWPLPPYPFNSGYRYFGLYRYTLSSSGAEEIKSFKKHTTFKIPKRNDIAFSKLETVDLQV